MKQFKVGHCALSLSLEQFAQEPALLLLLGFVLLHWIRRVLAFLILLHDKVFYLLLHLFVFGKLSHLLVLEKLQYIIDS